MTSASYNKVQKVSGRFVQPTTTVVERIDQLSLAYPHEQLLRQRRLLQAEWLKQAMARHWGNDLPQPFIGFDLDEGMFIIEWQSDSECNTLTVDAENRTGWYDPWPPGQNDALLATELDLDSEEGWERLRSALTTTQR